MPSQTSFPQAENMFWLQHGRQLRIQSGDNFEVNLEMLYRISVLLLYRPIS